MKYQKALGDPATKSGDLLLNSNPLFKGLDENSKNIISENLEKNIVEFEKNNS